MSTCDPQIITLQLSPAFLRTLKVEAEWAQLVDGIYTSIPDSLIRLATIVLAELEPSGGSNAPENR
jgi:hypothetical protein